MNKGRRRKNLKQLESKQNHESLRKRGVLTKQGRMRKKSRRDRCKLPQDLVMEILIRLPMNSLMRFKCVSKQWSSLITCRYFCNRSCSVTRQQPRLYMYLLDEDGRQRALLSASSTLPDNTSFVVNQELNIPGIGDFSLNVVRDLLCFSVRERPRIYNPSTKQFLTLPAPKSDIIVGPGQVNHKRFYIGHDPISDQYKILCTIARIVISTTVRLVSVKSEHWIFVLAAGGGSWRKVVPLENYCHHAPMLHECFNKGSVIHYMAWRDMYSCVVVSFDIRTEEMTIIHIPSDDIHMQKPAIERKAEIIEYDGKIAVFDYSHLRDKGVLDLWVLENVEEEEWSMERKVVQPCQRHLVRDICLIVQDTTKDGKVILGPLKLHSRFYILYYDIQSNDLRRVEIKGVPDRWFDEGCDYDLKLMDESENLVYLET